MSRSDWSWWGVVSRPFLQPFHVDSAPERQCLHLTDEILEVRLVVGRLRFGVLGAVGFGKVFLGPWFATFARFTVKLVMIFPVGACAAVSKGPFITAL